MGFNAALLSLRARAETDVVRGRALEGVLAAMTEGNRNAGARVGFGLSTAFSLATQSIRRGIVPSFTANEDSVTKIFRSIPLERLWIHSAHAMPETTHAR